MKFIFTLIILLLFTAVLWSQNTILDKASNSPIPFARYKYANSMGYSDLNGKIHVNLNLNDTLTVNCIGFEELVLIKSDVESSRVLYMVSKTEKLDTVEIKMNRPEMVLAAGVDSKRNGFRTYYIHKNHMFLTRLVPNNSAKSYRLNNIKVYFTTLKNESRYARKEGKQFAFKMSILNSEFKPIHEQVFLSKTKKLENVIDFDFSNAQVFIDEQILYISIENLGDLKEDGSFDGFNRHLRFQLSEKEYKEFQLDSYLMIDSTSYKEPIKMSESLFHNAYKDGDIKYPTGLPPTETYNLNPKMEFTVTEY